MTGAVAAFVASSVSVSLSPAAVSGLFNDGGTADVTTGSVIATATGGVAPYSYAWSAVSTNPYTWVITAPTAATTAFTCQSLPEGVVSTRTFQVKVTDAAGMTAVAQIVATARNKNEIIIS